MDSPVSAQEPEFEHERHPRRLSALYQYHNAPEVAPAHGLEYDDTIYPHSDKMTIVREFPFRSHHYTGKHAFDSENRPPRIIFGMKVRTFLGVAFIVLLVVVGAAVGGAVGGKSLQQGLPPATGTYGKTGRNSSSTQPTTTSISTFSAPTPTYTPLSDCPKSNGTVYTSPFTIDPTGSNSGNQSFTKYCDAVPPDEPHHISGTFVYSFSDCVNLCASFNFATGKTLCNVAYYQPELQRPSVNCWTGALQAILSTLQPQEGTDVAFLIPTL